jgi:hypothetical protein
MLSVTAVGCAVQVPANALAIPNNAVAVNTCHLFRDSPAKNLKAIAILNPFILVAHRPGKDGKTLTELQSHIQKQDFGCRLRLEKVSNEI